MNVTKTTKTTYIPYRHVAPNRGFFLSWDIGVPVAHQTVILNAVVLVTNQPVGVHFSFSLKNQISCSNSKIRDFSSSTKTDLKHFSSMHSHLYFNLTPQLQFICIVLHECQVCSRACVNLLRWRPDQRHV